MKYEQMKVDVSESLKGTDEEFKPTRDTEKLIRSIDKFIKIENDKIAAFC